MSRILAAGASVILLGILGRASTAPAADAGVRGDLRFLTRTISYPDSAGDPVTRLDLAVPLAARAAASGSAGADSSTLHVLVIATADEGGSTITRSWTRRYARETAAAGAGGGGAYLDHLELRLPPGEAHLHVEVEQPGSDRRGEADLPIRVPEYRGAPLSISDLILGECASDAAGGRRPGSVGPVLPRPFARYGDDVPPPCVLGLVRDGLPSLGDTAYTVRWTVKDRGGRTRFDSTGTVPRRDGAGEVLLRPSLDGLERGSYRVEVEATLGGERVRAEASFQVDESRIAFGHDAPMLRAVLGYVATNSELRELDASPDDSLAALWVRFWSRRDPAPRTPTNEALVKFMNRVEYAEQHFGVLEPGWRSDMGRTYIRFGPPDRVERVQNGISGPPTEIWHYDARNATYVFQDPDGFGRYRLMGSGRN